MAREIDHEADRHFRDRRDEARRRARDQHALRARRRDVDVADIDRAAQERDEIAREREERGRARRLPVGDDDLAAARPASASAFPSSTVSPGLIRTSPSSRKAATARGP